MLKPTMKNVLRLFKWISRLSPLEREGIRFSLCCILAVVLNLLLFYGVEDGGHIKSWAERPLTFLTSVKLINFMAYIIVVLFYLIFKAAILGVLKEFSGLLNFIATQITGAFYCGAIVCSSLAYKSYIMHNILYKSLAWGGVAFFVLGIMYFYIFQIFIQKKIPPRLY